GVMPAAATVCTICASQVRFMPSSAARGLFMRSINGVFTPGASILKLRLVRPPGTGPNDLGGAVIARGHWRHSARIDSSSDGSGTLRLAGVALPANKTKD